MSTMLKVAGGVIIGLVVLVGGCAALISAGIEDEGGSGGGQNAASENGGGGSDKPKTVGVGEALTLKGTTYKVTNVDTAQQLGDNQFNRVDANGRFVIVKLTLTNRKDEPATILDDNIRLVGGNGKNYSVSDDALLATEDQSIILEEIQPDNTERGTLIYDLPRGAVDGARLEVSDLFSDARGRVRLGL